MWARVSLADVGVAGEVVALPPVADPLHGSTYRI